MRISHTHAFSLKERQEIRYTIFSNILDALQTTFQAKEDLEMEYTSSDCIVSVKTTGSIGSSLVLYSIMKSFCERTNTTIWAT